jgi:hypothetical protein
MNRGTDFILTKPASISSDFVSKGKKIFDINLDKTFVIFGKKFIIKFNFSFKFCKLTSR